VTYARLSTLRGVRFAGALEAKYAALCIWLRRTTVGYRAARSARQANVVNADLSIYKTERGRYLTVGRVRVKVKNRGSARTVAPVTQGITGYRRDPDSHQSKK